MEVTYKYRRERDEIHARATRFRKLLNNDEGSTKKGGKCEDQARPEKSPTICPNLHHYRLPTVANNTPPGASGCRNIICHTHLIQLWESYIFSLPDTEKV